MLKPFAVVKYFRSDATFQTSILRLFDGKAGKTLAIMEANFGSWMETERKVR